MDGQQNSSFVDDFDTIDDASQVDGEAGVSSFTYDDDDVSDEFVNELDELGDDAIVSDDSDDDDSSLTPAAAALNLHDGNPQGKKPDATAKTDDKDDKSSEEDKDADSKNDDADTLSEEEEKYINNLPKPERAQAREWHKRSRMQTTFLDPKVPADQWVNNLRAKSEFRFGEVERAILKSSSADPVKLLTELYDATADGEGNSQAYGNLLEQAFETNRDFFNEIFAGKNLKLVAGDAAENNDSGLIDTAKLDSMTSEILAEIEESFSFQNFRETEPELAEKVLQSLKASELLKQELGDKSKTETPEEKAAREETERQSAEQKRTAEAQEARARIETFENAYTENVTDFYTEKLNRDYGLEITDKEREEFPLMAFLKDSKLAAIRYGIGEMPDFDDGLKEFAADRPAFSEATEAAIAYAKAKESANASNALRGVRPIADEYLKQRLDAPEIKFIDELMQMVAASAKKGLTTRRETVPTTLSTKPAADQSKGLLEDIDDLS